jgi:hypothetical protein
MRNSQPESAGIYPQQRFNNPPLYQVPGWPTTFESAKSKTYKLKTQTYMPNKTGLGYKRIMRQADGPAIYGCWCAMIHALSRQQSPRQGYCTDTGRADGKPWTAEDISLHTDMPVKVCVRMLAVCASETVGWLTLTSQYPYQGYHADTTGVVDGPSPLPSPLHLHLPSPSPYDSPESPSDPGPKAGISIPLIPSHGEYEIMQAQVTEWESLYPGVDVMQTLREIRGWNLASPARRKTRSGVLRHITTWLGKEQCKA